MLDVNHILIQLKIKRRLLHLFTIITLYIIYVDF